MINLKKIRTDKGVTQQQLAEMSGVNLRIIQHYEQGFKDIDKAAAITVYKLSQALEVPMESLLELKSTPE